MGAYIMEYTKIGNCILTMARVTTLNKQNGCNLGKLYKAPLVTAYYAHKYTDGEVIGKSRNILFELSTGEFALAIPGSTTLTKCDLADGLHDIFTEWIDL